MNYSELVKELLPQVMATMALINNPEIAPETRQLNQEILFREVGQAIYAKVYDMNAFDMEIPHTTGSGITDSYFGMAKVASGSISTGAVGLEEYVSNYLVNTAAKAQHDAFMNAHQSKKRPTASRRLVGRKNCSWCIGKAAENVTNPSPEFFHRHGGCDCAIITQGYRSRNGLLDNYVKPKDR